MAPNHPVPPRPNPVPDGVTTPSPWRPPPKGGSTQGRGQAGRGEEQRPRPVPTAAEFWEIAHQVCTPKEQDVLALMAGGLGWRRIGRQLNISPEAVRGRYERAERRIRAEQQRRQEAA